MSDTPKYRDPVRPITEQMQEWASKLDVLDNVIRPLPGGWQKRTFDIDPRLKVAPMTIGGVNIGPKNSDIVVYYEQVAILHHRDEGHVYVVFRETMDAILAQQKDPVKFPAWLMKSGVKQTERKYRYAVMTGDPNKADTLSDWLTDIEDVFGENSDIRYDTIDWYLLKKNLFPVSMYGTPPQQSLV